MTKHKLTAETVLDMLDALESLVLFGDENYGDDMKLDVWENAVKAIKAAGGETFRSIRIEPIAKATEEALTATSTKLSKKPHGKSS